MIFLFKKYIYKHFDILFVFSLYEHFLNLVISLKLNLRLCSHVFLFVWVLPFSFHVTATGHRYNQARFKLCLHYLLDKQLRIYQIKLKLVFMELHTRAESLQDSTENCSDEKNIH